MSRALPIFALSLTAALWALAGLTTADVFRRCLALWAALAYNVMHFASGLIG